jgi:hypothetical protein
VSVQACRARMAMTVSLTVAAFLCISTLSPSFAQTKADLTKEDKIKEIISRMHVLDSMKNGLERSVPTFVDTYKKRNPNMTTDQAEEILRVIRKSITDPQPSLESMFVEIYDGQLNDEQVDTLYTFYSTPIGAQIAERQQNVATAAALQAGTWGRSIWAPEITKRLQADDALKGLDLR